MKVFKFLAISFILLSSSMPSFSYSAESAVLEAPAATKTWEDVVQYARDNLPQEGQLIIKSDGFGYLKVDDAYIHELFPLLDVAKDGFKEPPYFRSEDSPGAHISLFYVDEEVLPEEAGQTFPFELVDIVVVNPSKYNSYIVFEVKSPALGDLREKYGLERKLHGHEFHISLAKKVIQVKKPFPKN